MKYAAYLYDIDYTWSESATEINDNRSFWSTSVETYDEKFSRKKIYCTKRCALKFKGSPWGQFLNIIITRVDMDEIDLAGTKVPKESATVK